VPSFTSSLLWNQWPPKLFFSGPNKQRSDCRIRTVEWMFHSLYWNDWLQQLLCLTCSVWGCIVVLKDCTLQQMPIYLLAYSLTQLSQCFTVGISIDYWWVHWGVTALSQNADATTFPGNWHFEFFGLWKSWEFLLPVSYCLSQWISGTQFPLL
jgi:hypothetical protein